MLNLKINDIKPYEKNAKKHPKSQIKQIAESIKKFGFNQPLVVNKDKIIVVGHGRWEAAKLLELVEVPCILVENLSEEEIKAYRLADNRLNESLWDMGLVVEELKEFSEEMLDLTGFDKDLIIDIEEDDFDAMKEYDKIDEPQAKIGDIYRLGEHRLICGDSTELDTYKKLLGEERAQCVFTDPPYNVGYDYTITYVKGRKRKNPFHAFNDKKTNEEFQEFLKQVFKNCHNFTKDNATFYCWHASKNKYLFRAGIEDANWGIHNTLYWLKNNCTFSRGMDYLYITEPCYFGWKKKQGHYVDKKYKDSFLNIIITDKLDFEYMLNMWYEQRDKIKDYQHPTQKPIRLAERALKKHTDFKDIVLEPFTGSGSTLLACEQLRRKCYAIELDPKFIDVIIKRWEKFTGNKAEKI